MHPRNHALQSPNKPAVIMAGSGQTITYGELEVRANQGAQLLRQLGLHSGDVVAVLMENHPRYLEVVWAAEHAGLYFCCLSSRLTADEAEYIVRDSGAKALITSTTLGDVPDALRDRFPSLSLLSVGGARPGYEDFEALRATMPADPVDSDRPGQDLLYSSGTTGRPKGVKPKPLEHGAPSPQAERMITLYGMDAQSVFLCPAPLYHAAPLRWCMAVHRLGGAVVLMEHFDAEAALAAIERYRVTHSQWVPTHFVRLLKLPPEIRSKYDLTTHAAAIHGAAPCAVHTKEAMMAWWGPIIHEYYGGTEGAGLCVIDPEEWLSHRGSVGRAIVGRLRICDPEGDALPVGAEGHVYFEGGPSFEYHNDPEKTAESQNKHGWRTLGDIGRIDADGYLYLTDRKGFMIISGGVNVYPQEIENALLAHPAVLDVAVFGVPDEEMGQRVVAVVQPSDWNAATPELIRDLTTFIRQKVSGVKVPREIHFRRDLPREPTGKLFKRLLVDEYSRAPTLA